jgi:hypothetical protein
MRFLIGSLNNITEEETKVKPKTDWMKDKNTKK